MRSPGYSMCDPRRGGIGISLDVAEERLGMGPHRRKLAPHIVSDPQAKVGRHPLGRILSTQRQLAGSCEGFGRLGRSVAARRDQRVAVGYVQLPSLLTARRIRLDLVAVRQRRKQRLRLGDLRHFRRRREPFDRGF